MALTLSIHNSRDIVVLGNLDHENYISILTITETEVEAYNIAIIAGRHLASCYLSVIRL